MPMFSTDFVVSREVQPLLDMGRRGDSGDSITRSSTQSDCLCGELDAGTAMN